jgi:hypothetical protein
MIIELSREELKLICQALTIAWLDCNDKAALVEDKNLVKQSMQEIDSLSDKLRERLNDDFALNDMPLEEEVE